MAERCVRGLMRTTKGYDLEVIAAVDNDEDTAYRLEIMGCYVNYSEKYRGNSAWNDALKDSVGELIVFAADDLEWQPKWLDAALQALSEHPGCLIGFNDGHWDGNRDFSTHYLLPREFIIEVLGGRVAWGEHYGHSFNDLETCERARQAGRYHWCEEARVYHSHWLFGDRPKDETDSRNLGGHGPAEAKYRERILAGFPDDLPPVITE